MRVRERMSIFLIILTLGISIASLTLCKKAGKSGPEAKIIKIGAVLPLTGPGSEFAEYIRQGLELALEEVNSEKSDYSFKIIYEDSKNAPKEGVMVFKNLVTLTKPPIVISALSSVTRAIAPLAKPDKTIILGLAVAIPGVSDISEFVFRLHPDGYAEAGEAARFALNQGYKKAGVIYINDDYGRSSFEVFKKVFEDGGGEVSINENFETRQSDFRTQALKFKEKNVEIIWVVGYGPAYTIVIKHLYEANIKAKIIGNMSLTLTPALETLGEASEGILIVDGKKSEDFINKFSAHYGVAPNSYAGYAYDALKIISSTIRALKSQDPERIIKNFLNTKNYSGAMGNISFKENGDANVEMGIYVIKDKKMRLLR